MLRLFRSQPLPIGVDVGSGSVKMLQLAAGLSGLAVAGAVRVAMPDDVRGDPDRRVEFAGEALRAAFRAGRFRGRRVVAALPKDVVHYKTHRLPPMPPADLLPAARIDARDLFRFDPDSADVQCLDAGDVRQGGEPRREVILVAAGKKYVDAFVRTLHRAGGRVASLEVEPSAVCRAAARPGGPGGEDEASPPQLLLDVGAAQSRLVIRAGVCVRVFKVIDAGAGAEDTAQGKEGGDGVRQAPQDATRLAVDTIAREVLASLRYHAVTFGGVAPGRVHLLGGGAGDLGIQFGLAEALAMPAGPFELFAGIDTSAIAATVPAASAHTASLGEWAVALGLALKGACPPRVAAPVRPDTAPRLPARRPSLEGVAGGAPTPAHAASAAGVVRG